MTRSVLFATILSILAVFGGGTRADAVKVTLEKELRFSNSGAFLGFEEPDPALLDRLGFAIIADYPSYLAGEVAEERLDGFRSIAMGQNLLFAVRRDFDQIQINGYPFSSFGTPTQLPQNLILPRYSGNVGLYLVQFKAPLTPQWHAALYHAMDVISYFPENTFLVRAASSSAPDLAQIIGVQHVSLYHPAYKIRRSLLDRDGTLDLTMKLDAGQDLDSLASFISTLTGRPTSFDNDSQHAYSRVSLSFDGLVALARRPEVLWIEPTLIPVFSGERDATIAAGKHDGDNPIRFFPGGHDGWLKDKGFCTPSGTTNWPACMPYWTRVAVVDSGLDRTHCAHSQYDEETGVCSQWEAFDISPDLDHTSNHTGACPPDGQGIAVFDDFLLCSGDIVGDVFFCSGDIESNHCEIPPYPPYTPGYYDFSDPTSQNNPAGHGTSVASIIAGDPLPDSPEPDPDGFFRGTGIAPSAQLVIGKFKTLAQHPNGGGASMTHVQFGELVSRIHENVGDVRFFNNSWNVVEYDSSGTPVGYDGVSAVQYTLFSQVADELVREARLDGEINEVTLVFSAGNWKGDPNTQWSTSPGNAKNVISVAAARGWSGEQGRPHPECAAVPLGDSHLIGDIAGGIEPGNPDPSVWHSRRGYVNEDGSAAAHPRYKPDLVAPGTYVTAARTQASSSSDVYRCFSGTSAAAPVVTGAAVLAEAYYFYKISNQTALPSPAMVKAMLVAHADSLVGGTDHWPGTTLADSPSMAQGWGRVNLDRLIQTPPPPGQQPVAEVAIEQDHDPTVGNIWTPSGEGRRFIFSGQYWSEWLKVSNTSEDIIVAMVFTDAPSDPAATSLTVNDLDLTLFKIGIGSGSGHRYWGNHFEAESRYSKNTAGQILPEVPFDAHNNVEIIRIPAGSITGTFWVKISARVIDRQAVPGLDFQDPIQYDNQDFALYVYNAEPVSE